MKKLLLVPFRWLTESTGSSRPMALIRLGLVANVWARWANEHVLYRDLRPESLVVNSVFFLSSTLTFFGLWTRFAAPLLAGTTFHFVYVAGHLGGVASYTHHHTTLLAWACFLLALAPSGRSLSVDRYLELRRAEAKQRAPRPEQMNLWAQRLMVIQLSSVYFWSAYDKLNWGFLSGARLEHYVMWFYTGPQELSLYVPGIETVLSVAAWTVVTLEFSLAFLLFSSRLRRFVLLPGFLLHGVFYFSLSVFTFSTTMWTLYLAVLDPEGLNRKLQRLMK